MVDIESQLLLQPLHLQPDLNKPVSDLGLSRLLERLPIVHADCGLLPKHFHTRLYCHWVLIDIVRLLVIRRMRKFGVCHLFLVQLIEIVIHVESLEHLLVVFFLAFCHRYL